MLTGDSVMQIPGGPFEGEQPTLAHFQSRVLSLLLRPSLCPKAIGGQGKDREKTQGNKTLENLEEGLEETKMGSGKNPQWMLTLGVGFIGGKIFAWVTLSPRDGLGL